jgi:hypothetical protein
MKVGEVIYYFLKNKPMNSQELIGLKINIYFNPT